MCLNCTLNCCDRLRARNFRGRRTHCRGAQKPRAGGEAGSSRGTAKRQWRWRKHLAAVPPCWPSIWRPMPTVWCESPRCDCWLNGRIRRPRQSATGIIGLRSDRTIHRDRTVGANGRRRGPRKAESFDGRSRGTDARGGHPRLAAQKDRESVEAAATDQSWRVRRAVATSLKAWPDRRSATLARAASYRREHGSGA